MSLNIIEVNDNTADQFVMNEETNRNNHKFDVVFSEMPEISTLSDIYNKSEEIINWCLNNPIDDHVYEFKRECVKNGNEINCIDMFNTSDAYVAGSYALRHLLDFLEKINKNKFTFNWNSNDVDIFFLNKDLPARNKIGKGLDIISSPEKSVQELLIGFDLPVCRVALNFEGSFYVSIQAMKSILTRKMNLPFYLKEKSSAYMIMENCCNNYYYATNEKDKPKSLPHFLIDRFYERLRKYSGRGFGVNWIETTKLIDWIKMRSVYAASRI